MLAQANEIISTFEVFPSPEMLHPQLSIDCVIFGYHEKQLKVLCTKLVGLSYCLLPGGFVRNEEGINEAASRILQERTGVQGLFLKQFGAFGDANRSLMVSEVGSQLKEFPESVLEKINWAVSRRFVSIGYYALVEFSKVETAADRLGSQLTWEDVHYLSPMISQHSEMVTAALKTLRRELHYEPIGANLLPEKFALSELQSLYETILGKQLDTRNFIKKLTSLDIVEKTSEKRRFGKHRPPTLYKFNESAYKKALEQEFELVF